MSRSESDLPSAPQAAPLRSGLSRRLVLAALLIGLLMALIGVIEWFSWRKVREIQTQFAAIRTEAFFLGIYFEAGITQLDATALRFLLSDDASEREHFFEKSSEMSTRLARTRPHLASPPEQELGTRLERAYENYLVQMRPLLERALKPVRKDSAARAHDQIHEHSAPVLGLAQELVTLQRQALARRFEDSQRALGSLHRALQAASLLSLALLAGVAVLAYRATVLPLRVRLSQTQAAVANQQKLASLGVLAAGVAHEIRNPLTAIKLRLFAFRKDLPPPLREHEDLSVIQGEMERLERIVQDFLQFARPSDPALAPVAAARLLEGVAVLFRAPLQNRGIQLAVEAPEALELHVDKHQIQQVLINLVRNAVESIEGPGHVWLRARTGLMPLNGQSRPVALLEVSDTGKGIPPEAEPRVFDPFFSTKETGTGLGLPIAARIAEKHGGVLHVQSQPHRGTTFTLVLPRS